jgi:hypothetical protein
MYSAVLRSMLLALALAMLSGCSVLRFGYGYLDTYAAWTANDYFDLDAHQAQDFRARFARVHEWHRYEQLPDYAAFLAEVRARVEKGLALEDWPWIADGARARYRVLIERSAADAAALLMTITPAKRAVDRRGWKAATTRCRGVRA